MNLRYFGRRPHRGHHGGDHPQTQSNRRPTVRLYAVAAGGRPGSDFAAENGVERAFGTYEGDAGGPGSGLVYIATPTPTTISRSNSAPITAKHVLCEKAFTVNARQAQDALAYARARGGAGH